ncbi:type VI secretion system protein TssA [Massilia pseudoviolaceinigra]|uniref:type VI secretion system protein TssA n=1 Tax=Massilia pseudoviolaceinigra TaxID=3057165 RepID=UPI0027968213|nr:type VI secretion system protein TssA [Massilia sp. CCM 9206]MDQ1919164.1 type VI secretion system protein TssA [Massilia sp. CCM 9206]
MNAITDFLVNDADRQIVAEILAPLAPDAPCGADMRFDPVFTEIRLLRDEDDPSLPMRQWERPLKVADWVRIDALCMEMLCTRSKHLQFAVWLTESWMRQRGFAGLCQGLGMLDALLRRYWDSIHPMIDKEGDCDLRLAPLEWLNESLSVDVRIHAVLLPLAQYKPPRLTLADWERMSAQDLTGLDEKQRGEARGDADSELTRAAILSCAAQSQAQLHATRAAVSQSREALSAINSFLNERLGDDAPNMSRLLATLEAAERVLVQLHPEQKAIDMDDEPELETVLPNTGAMPAPAHCDAGVTLSGWRNRADAYVTLDALARYLMELEPHSPVPFLIRRALHWGSMPLPELIAEIIREEGDLKRLVGVLGLKM